MTLTNRTAKEHKSAPQVKIARDGKQMYLNLPSSTDHIGAVIQSTGDFYEAELLDLASSFLKPDDFIVDVGANIGNHSLFFAKICSCNVVAYEAVESTADVLRQNMALNFLDSRVEVRGCAIGKSKGSARVTSYSPDNVGAATLKSGDGDIEVRALNTEDYSHPVRLLKIDVEGMEIEVLEGALELIQRELPIIICEAATPERQEEVLSLLRPFGYKLLGIYCATPTLLLVSDNVKNQVTNDIENFRQTQLSKIEEHIHDLDIRLLRSNRYTERLHREALAQIEIKQNSITPPPEQGRPEIEPNQTNDSEQLRDLVKSETDQLANRVRQLENSTRTLMQQLELLQQALTIRTQDPND